MIGGPPGHLCTTPQTQRFQIEFVDENIDDADRIVLRHVAVQAVGKQCRLPAILALDETLHPNPR